MRLRKPIGAPSPYEKVQQTPSIWAASCHDSEKNARVWNLEVTTITPIYGGGVKAGEPDPQMPIRVAALRGQLRFWWRLLASHHPSHPLSGPDLYRAEADLWGGMCAEEDDHASRVRLRLPNFDHSQLQGLIVRWGKRRRRTNGELRSLPDPLPTLPRDVQYVLFPGQGELDENDRTREKTKPAKVIMPGLKFMLRAECHGCSLQQLEEVQRTLRWWASFGGIGARTRRGLGSVEIKDLPPVTRCQAEQFGCDLRGRAGLTEAMAAWDHAVRFLRHFRQGEGMGRGPGLGRSYWPEADSIRAITGQHRIKNNSIAFIPAHPVIPSFPRAALGLPIIFQFQQKDSVVRDPDNCELRPVEMQRMASPLIIKAMASGDGNYAPVALRLPIHHLIDLRLELVNSGKRAHNPNLPHKLDRDDWWPADPVKGEKKGNWGSIPPSPIARYNGHDALSAFLNYFEFGPLP